METPVGEVLAPSQVLVSTLQLPVHYLSLRPDGEREGPGPPIHTVLLDN
jgi:hypothetical protein